MRDSEIITYPLVSRKLCMRGVCPLHLRYNVLAVENSVFLVYCNELLLSIDNSVRGLVFGDSYNASLYVISCVYSRAIRSGILSLAWQYVGETICAA